ncbi:hypothetical protein BC832DRAFT_567908 [Gaertneriomyces semiglobifer]|nr:hypothetical protein BC832DRAFT_567908 [Gaertneriomyces semiglobifer]
MCERLCVCVCVCVCVCGVVARDSGSSGANTKEKEERGMRESGRLLYFLGWGRPARAGEDGDARKPPSSCKRRPVDDDCYLESQ